MATVMQPFNALQTLQGAEAIRGMRGQNAAQMLRLQREQDPNSLLNQRRELELQTGQLGLNTAREQLRAAQIANAAPQLRSALDAIGSVKETIANRGASAGRQRFSERLSFLQSQGILPEDFDLGMDPSELSDEEFVREIEQAEQDLSSTLAVLPTGERSPTAPVREMQAFGYPMTREGFQQYNQDRGSGTVDGLESLIAEARLRGLLMEQERGTEDREAARRAQRQQIVRNLEQNELAVDLTERLEGTMLESGSVIPSDMRRGIASLRQLVSPLTGDDAGQISQMIADFDTQRKTLQDQVNARIASGEYGRSATQLSSIERSLANPEISPQAIIRIQGQLAQMDLDRADAENLKIENREQWERRAKEWKNYDPVTSSIPRMSRQQLRQLDIDSLTDEQAEAALKRLDQLEQ